MSHEPRQGQGLREGVEALVVGAGRFGGRALKELRRLHADWRLMAVDRDWRALVPWIDSGVIVQLGDAVETLDRLLQEAPPRWIVPAVPLHLACCWLHHRLSTTRPVKRIPIPPGLPVPNPLHGPSADLYTSFATFICPEDCPEPEGTCTVTGEKRPVPLFQLLRDLAIPGQKILGLQSRQLGPGVGGYLSEDMRRLLAAVERIEGDLMLYTACRCHGVLSALRVGPVT